MTNYDSDSSDGTNAFTTTSVILGYASNESSGDDVSHIGGQPVWLDEKSRPPGDLSKCKNCNGHLSLLLQLNADVQQHFPNDTRRIYVWSCKNKACSRKPGTIRAFREVKKTSRKKQAGGERLDPAQPSSTPHQDSGLGSLLFGGTSYGTGANTNLNPFSLESTSTTAAHSNPFATTQSSLEMKEPEPPSETFAEKLKLGTTTQATEPTGSIDQWPNDAAFSRPYPHFYLDAYPEELDPVPALPAGSSSTANVRYDTEDVSSASAEKESFESTLDKTFQKFSDIVAQNPEQVLRYEFRGQPLLYSGADAVSARFMTPHGKAGAVKGMPRCEACRSPRVFELQLTPYLIFETEKDDQMGIDDGMEWGTIIIGTCTNNCGDDTDAVAYREEWVGTQWEERVSKK